EEGAELRAAHEPNQRRGPGESLVGGWCRRRGSGGGRRRCHGLFPVGWRLGRNAGRGCVSRAPHTRQRVPASARLATVAALSLVTKPGPVLTGRPPPTVLALVL